jgi:hypothetical protein
MEPASVDPSNLDWFRAIVDMVGSVSWPAAVVAIAFIFRHEIKKKVADVKEAGPHGVTFHTQSVEVTARAEAREPLSLPQAGATPFQGVVRATIDRELSVIDETKKVPVLVDALSNARVTGFFESVFANIFGSQIRALEELEAAGGNTSLQRAKAFFEDTRNAYPDFYATANFEHWAKYLTIQGLVSEEGDNVAITDAGRDFLVFVRTRKAGQGRAF